MQASGGLAVGTVPPIRRPSCCRKDESWIDRSAAVHLHFPSQFASLAPGLIVLMSILASSSTRAARDPGRNTCSAVEYDGDWRISRMICIYLTLGRINHNTVNDGFDVFSTGLMPLCNDLFCSHHHVNPETLQQSYGQLPQTEVKLLMPDAVAKGKRQMTLSNCSLVVSEIKRTPSPTTLHRSSRTSILRQLGDANFFKLFETLHCQITCQHPLCHM